MTLPCQWGQKATWSHKWTLSQKNRYSESYPASLFNTAASLFNTAHPRTKFVSYLQKVLLTCYHSRRYSTKKSAGHFQSFDQLLKCIPILGKYHLQVSHFYLIYGKALHFELLLLTWSSCCWPQRNISPNFQGFFWKFGG